VNPTPSVTHGELVELAAKWLCARSCGVVVTELVTLAREQPDAIGWKFDWSILVECKTSRADYYADKQKFVRRWPEFGMGRFRWYCAPAGVLVKNNLPPRWGLLELVNGRLLVRKQARPFNAWDSRKEIALLSSATRRIGQSAPKGISVRCYTMPTKDSTTVGVRGLESVAVA
jgi:hypothetical protein